MISTCSFRIGSPANFNYTRWFLFLFSTLKHLFASTTASRLETLAFSVSSASAPAMTTTTKSGRRRTMRLCSRWRFARRTTTSSPDVVPHIHANKPLFVEDGPCRYKFAGTYTQSIYSSICRTGILNNLIYRSPITNFC